MGSWKYKFRHWFIMLNGSKIYDEKEEKIISPDIKKGT